VPPPLPLPTLTKEIDPTTITPSPTPQPARQPAAHRKVWRRREAARVALRQGHVHGHQLISFRPGARRRRACVRADLSGDEERHHLLGRGRVALNQQRRGAVRPADGGGGGGGRRHTQSSDSTIADKNGGRLLLHGRSVPRDGRGCTASLVRFTARHVARIVTARYGGCDGRVDSDGPLHRVEPVAAAAGGIAQTRGRRHGRQHGRRHRRARSA
jgi:hypothetical protein